MSRSVKLHKEGNRDLNRAFSSLIPSTQITLLNLLNAGIIPSISGSTDMNRVNSLVNKAVQNDPSLKVNIKQPKPPVGKYAVGGSNYNPKLNKVNLYAPTEGITAHELGHAKQYSNPKYRKHMAPAAMASRLTMMSGLGILAPVLSDDEKTAKTSSAIASGLGIPALAEEIHASFKGSQMLSKQKSFSKLSKAKKALHLMKPFAGMPSYVLTAVAPYLVYKYMKKKGKYAGTYESED